MDEESSEFGAAGDRKTIDALVDVLALRSLRGLLHRTVRRRLVLHCARHFLGLVDDANLRPLERLLQRWEHRRMARPAGALAPSCRE